MPTALRILHSGTAADIGGKAAALSALSHSGLPIPPWFVVGGPEYAPTSFTETNGEVLQRALTTLAPLGEPLAVRSSAVEEDSTLHSFAGQYESRLFVAPSNVPDTILALWRDAISDRVIAYRSQHGLTGPAPLPAILVQRMVNADVAGVAFSADPVSGRRATCVVAATYGLGTALVSGDVDADTWHVQRDGAIAARQIAEKRVAHRYSNGVATEHVIRKATAGTTGIAENGEATLTTSDVAEFCAHGRDVVSVAVAEELVHAASLNDAQLAQVAQLARATEQHFGRPQDIEWAFENGQLYLLQSRPITSMNTLADPDGEVILWDNSNIVESYGGITTPLTFSFARYVYENVYREFCRMLRVSPARLDANEGALRSMLGLVRGRVYYNLVSWYRILALLPGYRVNRAFMEQMMGVTDTLPTEIAVQFEHQPTRREKYSDLLSLVRTSWALIRAHRAMSASIAAFDMRLNTALALDGEPGPVLSAMRADQLVAHYRELERALLAKWDAPLVNDFFAMIFYGVLRKLTLSWCRDTNGTLQNDLVSSDGSVISAEPAQRIVKMATLIQHDTELTHVLCTGSLPEVYTAIAGHIEFQEQFTSYLAKFGDRCLEELKLETMTLDDDPLLLAQSIGRLARAKGMHESPTEPKVDIRGDAERQAFAAIGFRPIRRVLFRWVLKHARHRIRDRENLRFERTRVFGRVRRVFVELGKRYHAIDQLDAARDIFYLTVDEVLGWHNGATSSSGLRALANARKAEFDVYHATPAPPDRFITRGMVHVGELELPPVGDSADAQQRPSSPLRDDDTERTGTGCYPGKIRGPVRVVDNPRNAALEPGEILVALRTDPGWVMLFPAASGLLVERGSLLSHSAIVARELALPAVVSIPGLTTWLRTGDVVEFDGRTGIVTRTERAEPV